MARALNPSAQWKMSISPCKSGELVMAQRIPMFSQKVFQQGESCLEGQECRLVTVKL